MAKTSTARKYSLSPLESDISNDPNVSGSFKKDMGKYYQSAINDIQNGSFAARHPLLNTAKNAVIGGALLGPAGLFMLPLAGNINEQNRVNGIRDAFQTAAKNRSEIEKNLLEPRQSTALGGAVTKGFNADAYESPLAPGAPVSVEGAKLLLGNSPMVQNQYRNQINEQNNTASGVIGNMLGQQQTPYDNQSQSLPPFQVGAQTTEEVPLRPYRYVDNAMLQKGLENNQQLLSAGITNAPKYAQLPFDIQKTIAESQKLAAEGKTEQAKQKLLGLQAQFYPKLTQSEINRNNYHAPSYAPQATTPGMGYKFYMEGRFGTPGSPKAIQGLQNFIQTQPADTVSVTTDEEGKTKTTRTSRARGGVASNPQAVAALKKKYAK